MTQLLLPDSRVDSFVLFNGLRLELKNARGVAPEDLSGQFDRLTLRPAALKNEILREETGQHLAVHVVFGKDELEFVSVAVVTELFDMGNGLQP